MEQWITALLLLGALMIVYRLVIAILMRKKMVEGFVGEIDESDEKSDEKSAPWTIDTAADKLKNYTNEIDMTPEKIKNYKEIVTNVDNHVAKSQLVMLHKISKDIATDVSSDKTIAKMEKLNSLSKFRRTLVEQMNYLQGLEQNIG
jgi:hypothetical protein